MLEITSFLNDLIWSNVFIVLCLGTGLYFTLATKFVQIRYFWHMIRLLLQGSSSSKGVSSFQAFSVAISGRVGTGNIAGVATAIAYGGPGAVFWMWIIAFFGAGSAFTESVLAQIYKTEQNGQFRGGPAYYIEKGLGIRWYANLFAIVTVISVGLCLPGVQSNTIATAMDNAFAISPWISATFVICLLAMIIFGGIKRISLVAEMVVPLMAAAYLLVALLVTGMNIERIPEVLSLIVKSAFASDATFGGMIGSAIAWGVKRGIYSNEAGQGTGPHAAAAAEVSHPVKQGLVQAFSVYIDTLLICTATAFMILLTGSYNVIGEGGQMIVNHAGQLTPGPSYTQMAVDSAFTSTGSSFVAISLLFFAFTTLMAYYYIAETNIAYLTRKKSGTAWILMLRIGILVAVGYSATNSAAVAWSLGDMGVGMMAWLNLIAIILLRKPALKALKDYESQYSRGVNPGFHPEKLQINSAEIWTPPAHTEKPVDMQRF